MTVAAEIANPVQILGITFSAQLICLDLDSHVIHKSTLVMSLRKLQTPFKFSQLCLLPVASFQIWRSPFHSEIKHLMM